jgi:hypothetical protein
MRYKNTVKGTKALPQSASEIPSQQGYATAAEVDYRASEMRDNPCCSIG